MITFITEQQPGVGQLAGGGGPRRNHFLLSTDVSALPAGVPVKSFGWQLDNQEARALAKVQTRWRSASTSPWPTTELSTIRTVRVKDKSQATLIEHAGGGTMRQIRLRIEAGGNSAAVRKRLAEALWLDMTWDKANKPQVSAPLGAFFLAPDSAIDVRGLWLGCVDGEYYSYLPMPFRRHARISLRLTKPVGAKVSVQARFAWGRTPPEAHDGLFHTKRYDVTNAPQGKNRKLLDVRVRGHVVGVMADRDGDVESDDSWLIDGETKPSIVGTGTEDLFNFAWGLGDLQSPPMHGARVPFGPPSKRGQRTDTGVCYRFHLPPRPIHSASRFH